MGSGEASKECNPWDDHEDTWAGVCGVRGGMAFQVEGSVHGNSTAAQGSTMLCRTCMLPRMVGRRVPQAGRVAGTQANAREEKSHEGQSLLNQNV